MSSSEDLAYEGAKASGTTQHMRIEIITVISGIYKHQQVVHDLSNSILTQLMNMDSETKTIDAMIMLQKLTTDVLENEASLLKGISASIEKIEELQ
ncbi:MAG: hypothetical protein AAF824_18950 [Bacteroidota bacterium]